MHAVKCMRKRKIKHHQVKRQIEQIWGFSYLHFNCLVPVRLVYVLCDLLCIYVQNFFSLGVRGERLAKHKYYFFVLLLCYCLLFGVAYLLLLIWLMTDRRISRWSWGSGRRKHARWKSRRRRRYVWHAGRWWLELNRIHTQKKLAAYPAGP